MPTARTPATKEVSAQDFFRQAIPDYDRVLRDNARLLAERAQLVEALNKLIALHCDWEPQGRATRKFCDSNNAAIATARALLRSLGEG